MDRRGSSRLDGTPKLTRAYLGNRAMTIAGGTSGITRNTIAERILGLPGVTRAVEVAPCR